MEEPIEEPEILRIGELASVIQDGDLFGDSEFANRDSKTRTILGDNDMNSWNIMELIVLYSLLYIQ